MRITEKEHKKLKKAIAEKATKSQTISKKIKENTTVPAWFNQENETETPSENDREAFDELDKILQELV